MGIDFEFSGRFSITPPLTQVHHRYLTQFALTRRMQRDSDIAASLPDPVRESVGLPIGTEGAYFVGGQGDFGQSEDESVVDHNIPPAGQPGLWCHWIPTDDGRWLVLDQGDKFYFFVGWLRYLIEHFLQPWGYTVAGCVTWSDDEDEETGAIRVEANRIVELINDPDELLEE